MIKNKVRVIEKYKVEMCDFLYCIFMMCLTELQTFDKKKMIFPFRFKNHTLSG